MSDVTITDDVSAADSGDDTTPDPAPAPEPAPAADEAPKTTRRAASNIEGDLKAVCDEIVLGTRSLPEGKTATPHFLALAIQSRRGTDDPVSTGAVTACLKRWVEYGYINTHDKPFAFADYTEAGRTQGLNALKQARRDARAAERAAAKEAAKVDTDSADASTAEAAPAADTEPTAAPEPSGDVPF